jgi:hypothetical protein
MDDLEDQLHQLVHLAGPNIKRRVLKKIKGLARQVDKANKDFLATKILNRAVIFNIFTQDTRASTMAVPFNDNASSKDEAPPLDDDQSGPVTPFPRFAHTTEIPFEASGRIRCPDVDHLDLVKGPRDTDERISWISRIQYVFNSTGCRKF